MEQYDKGDGTTTNIEEYEEGNVEPVGYQSLKEENLPTQTHGLVTTVPQNISNLKIGDKHSPTRNSLRHSRMIVMNKSGRVPTQSLPPIIQYHDRAMCIMWIILIIGTIICFESSSLQIYAANSSPYLNPFYIAVPILSSGIFGFVHLRCCRKEYPGLRRNACEKSIKVFSITSSMVACVTSFIYIFNILIHLISFLYLECAPPDLLTETCICRLSDQEMMTSIFNNNWDYVDLSCFELYYIFNVIIGLTGLTSLVTIVFQIYYLNLHWMSRSTPQPAKAYNFI